MIIVPWQPLRRVAGRALVLWSLSSVTLASGLSLQDSVRQALASDPDLISRTRQSEAFEADRAAARYWPDPRLSLAAMNLPADTLDLNQEGMTQLQLGITQMLPPGDTLALQVQKQALQRHLSDSGRQLKARELQREVALLWLEAARALAAWQLTGEHLTHLQQQAQILTQRYRYAGGNSDSSPQQQDLLRAGLDIQRVQEQRLALQQQYQVARQRLNEWLTPAQQQTPLQLADQPRWQPPASAGAWLQDDPPLVAWLQQHPLLLQAQQRIGVAQTEADLIREQEKPRWSLQASYGYRADDPQGHERADFVSVGVGVELPLFNGERRERRVSASLYRREAEQARQQLVLRQLMSGWRAEWQQYRLLQQRLQMYDQQLLPQLRRQRDAVNVSYGQGRDEFGSVIRAQMEQLNGEIERLNLQRELHKTAIRLEYYAPASAAGEEYHHAE